jgi:hypothetical protein
MKWLARLALAACALSACGGSGSATIPVPPHDAATEHPESGSAGAQGAAGSGGPGTAGTGQGSAGSGSAGSGSAGSGAGGAAGSVFDGGADASGDVIVMPPPCKVTISPVSASSLDNLPAGTGATLRVRGVISGTSQPDHPDWNWHVDVGDGHATVSVKTPDPQDPSVVEFPLTLEGRYYINVSVQEVPFCGGSNWATATLNPTVPYHVRITPPHGLQGLAPYERDIDMQGGHAANLTFNFFHTTSVAIDPQDATTKSVGSYVQITSPQHSWSSEGDTMKTAFKTALVDTDDSRYDVLVVPLNTSGPPFAPLLSTGLTAARVSAPMIIDPGVTVMGTVALDGGASVGGATILLRSGALPSTVGHSDGGGAFSLQARGGRFSAVVTPAAGSALPEAHVDADDVSGVDLPMSSGGPVSLSFSWRSGLATRTLTARFLGSDGSAAAGIDVRLDSDAGSLPNVGLLHVTNGPFGPQMLVATGAVHRTATTDGSGAVSFADLPAATYQLMGVPPVPSRDGLTIAPVDLSGAAPAAPLTVNLERKVAVTGLLPNAPAGTRILVIDDQPVPIPGHDFPAAAVSATGAYALSLDPRHAYHLLADPPAGQMLSRVPLGKVETGTAAIASQPRTLPRMLALTGSVQTFDGAMTVAGAKLQIFCVGASPDCVDPLDLAGKAPLPLFEATTDALGGFALWVPDPAITVCTPGQDQTCNENPALSSIHGHCTDAATCTCSIGGLNPATGRCY